MTATGSRTRLSATIVALFLVCACNDSPTTPSSSLPLTAGIYVLSFMGVDAVGVGSAPSVPGCPGIGVAGMASTYVDLTNDAGVWRARPRTAGAGSFELRFSPGALGVGAPGGGPGVTATATGALINTLITNVSGAVPDTHVVFGDGVTLTGGLTIDGYFGSGRASGPVAFTSSSGTSISCNSGTVSWTMSR